MHHDTPGPTADLLSFLRRWLAAPRTVGAIAPSSRALARAMCAAAGPLDGPVLELGAGTGVFTRALVEAGVDPAALVLVERLPAFAALLRARWPQARVIEGDAGALTADALPAPPAVVLSGLPLRAMPAAQVERIVAAVLACSAPALRLVQFTYGLRCPVAAPLRRRLGLRARRVAFVAGNLPPAWVWVLQRETERQASDEAAVPARGLSVAPVPAEAMPAARRPSSP